MNTSASPPTVHPGALNGKSSRLPHAVLLVTIALFMGASYRTENFIVTASSPEFARQVGEAAELQRENLAKYWLGDALPRWPEPCPIDVTEGSSLRGRTSYVIANQQPRDWRMSISGPRPDLLSSVLPHEVLHTLLATHLGRPLPRAIEEGICVTAESAKSRDELSRRASSFTDGQPITIPELLDAQDYPPDIARFYFQGYSLARFLLEKGGRRTLIDFLADGLADGHWGNAAELHYGVARIDVLQEEWDAWRRRVLATSLGDQRVAVND